MTEPTPAPAPVDEALTQRVAEALLTVQLRLGPNALTMAQRGEPIRLSLGEADTAAAAVLAELASELASVRMYSALSAANARYRLEIDRLTGLLGQYADRAIANGQRAEQAEDLLRIAHETSNASEAARAAAVQRAEEAEAQLSLIDAMRQANPEAAGAGIQRAEQAETAPAGIPLICSDERHQAKVAALEAEVQRLAELVEAQRAVIERQAREALPATEPGQRRPRKNPPATKEA
ncbi:hypothetical protein [Actinacidiphila acididurans]|uniref:Uncharacterized protein n=1 Tax=Actinacidiphila acididurans TaxID=2784346 RepID=A0ABS2U393_9ACTN|nr:hypothetical protein [Actinacidiphila acididurans]MBM9510054.1 hypothetical protein [Actinacidiphila acididurans]